MYCTSRHTSRSIGLLERRLEDAPRLVHIPIHTSRWAGAWYSVPLFNTACTGKRSKSQDACFSATHEAHASVSSRAVLAMGQAAGTAAAALRSAEALYHGKARGFGLAAAAMVGGGGWWVVGGGVWVWGLWWVLFVGWVSRQIASFCRSE